MTREEFSDRFTVLLNSFDTRKEFGDQASRDEVVLDEYEKSLFLTQAQEDVVLSIYNGRNFTGLSFEETEEMRRYLANLVVEAWCDPISNASGIPYGIDSKSKFFTLPNDPKVWFITYEAIKASGGERCDGETTVEVIPVTQDEYHRIKKNPFRGANDRRALRLDLSEGQIEIVSSYTNVSKYYLRYLRRPEPIILVDLEPSGLTIEGKTEPSGCELHEAIHAQILEQAVNMALQTRNKGRQNTGQR